MNIIRANRAAQASFKMRFVADLVVGLRSRGGGGVGRITVQYSKVQGSKRHCSIVQLSTVQYSPVQSSTVQYSTVHCSTVT